MRQHYPDAPSSKQDRGEDEPQSTLRMREIAAYLRVSPQRVTQMYAEGKLPEPERVDGIEPLWKPAAIERLGRAGMVGYAALEEAERAMVSTGTKKRYLRGAADHWRKAVRLQRQRLGTNAMDTRIDLNFYLVAVTRLCEIAERAINFPESDDVREALRAFRSRWPHLRRLRNEEEHFKGPQGGRGWYYFQRDVMDESGTFLLDAEDREPDIESLYQALCDFLGDPEPTYRDLRNQDRR